MKPVFTTPNNAIKFVVVGILALIISNAYNLNAQEQGDPKVTQPNTTTINDIDFAKAGELLKIRVEKQNIFKLFPIIEIPQYFKYCRENGNLTKIGVSCKVMLFETNVCPSNNVSELCDNTLDNLNKYFTLEVLDKVYDTTKTYTRINVPVKLWKRSDLLKIVSNVKSKNNKTDWIIIPAKITSNSSGNTNGLISMGKISGVDVWLLDVAAYKKDDKNMGIFDRFIFTGIYPTKSGWFFVSDESMISNIQNINSDKLRFRSKYSLENISNSKIKSNYGLFRMNSSLSIQMESADELKR